jgi:hypothetical protein
MFKYSGNVINTNYDIYIINRIIVLGNDRGSNITKLYRNSFIRKYVGPIPVAAQSEA